MSGGLVCRELVGVLSHWVVSTVIWALWILFSILTFGMCLVLMKEDFLPGWNGNVVETDGGQIGLHFLSNILWEQVSSKCSLAKVTKNLLIFCC